MARALETLIKSFKEAEATGDTLEQARWANQIGHFLKNRGGYAEALQWFREDYDISKRRAEEDVASRRSLMTTCQMLGEIYLLLDQHENARKFMEKHHKFASEDSDLVEQQRASTQLGRLYMELFSKETKSAEVDDIFLYVETKKHLEAALSIAERLRANPPDGDTRSFVVELIDAYNNLGLWKEEQDDTDGALALFQKALKICEDEEVSETEPARSRVHHNLGRMYIVYRDWKKALSHTQKDVEICGNIGHKQGAAKGYINLGEIYTRKLDFEEALQCYKNALSIAMKLEDEGALKDQIQSNISIVIRKQKELAKFESKMQRQKQLQRLAGEAKGTPEMRNLLKQEHKLLQELIDLAGGNTLQAWDKHLLLAKRLKRVCDGLGDTEKVGDAMATMGESYQNLRQFDKAKKWQLKSLEICKRLGHIEGQSVALLNYGNALDNCGEWEPALQQYKAAYDKARSQEGSKYQKLQVQALENMHSSYLLRLEQFEDARNVASTLQQLKQSLRGSSLLKDSEECPETDCEDDSPSPSQACETPPASPALPEDPAESPPVGRRSSSRSRAQRLKDLSDDDCCDKSGEQTPVQVDRVAKNGKTGRHPRRLLSTKALASVSDNASRQLLHVSDSEDDQTVGEPPRTIASKRNRSENQALVGEVQAKRKLRRICKSASKVRDQAVHDELPAVPEDSPSNRMFRGYTTVTLTSPADLIAGDPGLTPTAIPDGEQCQNGAPCTTRPASLSTDAVSKCLDAELQRMQNMVDVLAPLPSGTSALDKNLHSNAAGGACSEKVFGMCQVLSAVNMAGKDELSPVIFKSMSEVGEGLHPSHLMASTEVIPNHVPSATDHFEGPATLQVEIIGDDINVVLKQAAEQDSVWPKTLSWLEEEIQRVTCHPSIPSGNKAAVLCNISVAEQVEFLKSVLMLLKKGDRVQTVDSGSTIVALSDQYIAHCHSLKCPPNVAVMERLTKLVESEGELVVSGCNMDDASAQPLLAALETRAPVSVLDMSHNKLGNETMKSIQMLISKTGHKDLGLTIDLHNNLLGAACLAKICDCPITVSRLEVLNLSGNKLTKHVGRSLAKLLEKCSALASLELQACGIDTITVERITSSLPTGSRLSKLAIGRNPISGLAIADLLSKLATLKSFAELDLREISLDETGVKSLTTFLSNSKSISSLTLAKTDIRNGGADVLSNFLQEHPCRLLTLNLSSCGFFGTSAVTLCKQVMYIQGLSFLDLSGNVLNTEAADRIAEGLKRSGCRLKVLHLGGCSIGSLGAIRLLESLKDNSTLVELYLADNEITLEQVSKPSGEPKDQASGSQEVVREEMLPKTDDIADSEDDGKPEPLTRFPASQSRKRRRRTLEQSKPRVSDSQLVNAIKEARVLQMLELSTDGMSLTQVDTLFDAWSCSRPRQHPEMHWVDARHGLVHFSSQRRPCCAEKPCCK